MNDFRASLSGKPLLPPQLLGTKRTLQAGQNNRLDAVTVPREAVRTTDHRANGRHRLVSEQAVICYLSTLHPVELINLSGGGAMLEGSVTPRLWDKVDLYLGEHGSIECIVRWIRRKRFGLEFAHETQIDAESEVRDHLLREVVRRSFANVERQEVVVRPLAIAPAVENLAPVHRASPRHPMIWSGQILYQHDAMPVRLRNISADGAMVQSSVPLPVGAEVYLDLSEAGNVFAKVSWMRGDQVGLRFARPYDVTNLAKAKPTLTPQDWSMPNYLRGDKNASSPWADRWGRLTVEELEGFLRH